MRIKAIASALRSISWQKTIGNIGTIVGVVIGVFVISFLLSLLFQFLWNTGPAAVFGWPAIPTTLQAGCIFLLFCFLAASIKSKN